MKSKNHDIKSNNIRKTVSMSNLVNGNSKQTDSQGFSRYQKENSQDYLTNSFHSFSSSMLATGSKEDVSSEDGETIISDNEDNESEVQQNRSSWEDITQNEEERMRKTSVKHLADRFSNESLDGNSKVRENEKDELSHIPEDLRQFFRNSSSSNTKENVQDFTASFRANRDYDEIADMVSEFNREKITSENHVTMFDESQTSMMVDKNKHPNRVPEHLIRLFDQSAKNHSQSSSPKYDERKSSKLSEKAYHYDIKSGTNI